MTNSQPNASRLLIIVAFAIVYLVWGSTYFFIRLGVAHIPPYLMAGVRFIIAGSLLLGWCAIKGLPIINGPQIKTAFISGFLLLFIANGTVGWVEKTLPSSLVAILVSAGPIWLILLDKPMWKTNFSNSSTLFGLLVGFAGVLLLFSEQLRSVSLSGNSTYIISMAVLLFTSMCWSGGSLYSKYYSSGPIMVTTAWQMLTAGIVTLLFAGVIGETRNFHIADVTPQSWLALGYLIVFGSLAAFSAYVWLLQVRPATQVSTHAYVNPVVAVILGVCFGGEKMSPLQIAGLFVILTSVLLINLAKYRKAKEKPGLAE